MFEKFIGNNVKVTYNDSGVTRVIRGKLDSYIESTTITTETETAIEIGGLNIVMPDGTAFFISMNVVERVKNLDDNPDRENKLRSQRNKRKD